MLALVAGFSLMGYTLVYAAVANGGKFAAAPWESLRASAYDDAAAGVESGGGTHHGGSGGIIGAAGTVVGIAKKLLPMGGLIP